MPIEFFELPQGTPSVNPVGAAATTVAYCTPSDACSLDKARLLGVGNNPTLTDLDGYILMIAGEIDGLLLSKGYNVPVNVASYPEVAGLLCGTNAKGAAWMLEESSPAPQQNIVDRLKAAYDNALQMLRDADFALDIPTDQDRSKPRAPYLTLNVTGRTYDPTFGRRSDSGRPPGGDPRNPYFSKSLMF